MGSRGRLSGGGESRARNPTHKRKAERPTVQRERLGATAGLKSFKMGSRGGLSGGEIALEGGLGVRFHFLGFWVAVCPLFHSSQVLYI